MNEDNHERLVATLEAIGKKRHGKNWKARIADDMGCSRSTITLWVQGKRRIRGFAADKVRQLANRSRIKKSDVDTILFVDIVN